LNDGRLTRRKRYPGEWGLIERKLEVFGIVHYIYCTTAEGTDFKFKGRGDPHASSQPERIGAAGGNTGR